MALLSSHLRFATDRYWITARRGGRALVAGVLAAGMGYLGYQEVRLSREYVWLQKAAQAEPYSPEQLASLERAHAIEPRNFGTAYSLGETNRNLGFDTGEVTLVSKAMEWYELGIKANPFNGYNYLRYGMCLDFLERFEEAEPYISKADELEPNNYYVAANIGWHYVQAGHYAAARPWLERSLRLQWKENAIAVSYLAIANERLLEAASTPGFPATPADPIPPYRATDDAAERTEADPRDGENNN
jgi:tetratricopeptide (TPR) repeat protein